MPDRVTRQRGAVFHDSEAAIHDLIVAEFDRCPVELPSEILEVAAGASSTGEPDWHTQMHNIEAARDHLERENERLEGVIADLTGSPKLPPGDFPVIDYGQPEGGSSDPMPPERRAEYERRIRAYAAKPHRIRKAER